MPTQSPEKSPAILIIVKGEKNHESEARKIQIHGYDRRFHR